MIIVNNPSESGGGVPYVSRQNKSTDVYSDVVNYAGKGKLVSIMQVPAVPLSGTKSGQGWIRITIDGTAIDEFPMGFFAHADGAHTGVGSVSMTFNFEFKTSLRVEHRTATATGENISTAVSYTRG